MSVGIELACNDDAAAPAACAGTLQSSITFTATQGTTYYIRAASFSSATVGTFPINVTAGSGAMNLVFSSPGGAGSVQIDMSNGPAAGGYFLALTFYAGAFPNGWLHGLDIPFPELSNELNTGFPFLGPLDPCGAYTLGPISGLGAVSGIPFYAVALGLPAGSGVPSIHSSATTYTIP